VSLTLETSSGTVASGSYLSASVSAGTTYYLHVSASSGSGHYRLRGRMLYDAPAISGISATSGVPGDSVTVSGTNLGASVSDVWVHVGGVLADVTSASSTSLTFTVPLQALDGYVEVCTVGGCDQTAFTTGSSSFSSPLDYSRPDPADLSPFGGHPMWFNRIIVSYTGNVDATDAATVMDDAVTALGGVLTGYTQTGFIPYDNTYDWELTWDSSATLTDYVDLIDQLGTEADVDGIDAETPVQGTTLGTGMDMGMLWSGVQDAYAAQDIIGAEETWRLLATSYPLVTLGSPVVDVVDAGMFDNAVDGIVPFSAGNVSEEVYQPTSGTWAEYEPASASDPLAGSSPSHGEQVAALIGAANRQSPAWDGGAHTKRMCGILGCTQQYGVDDDGDSSMDTSDSDGEAFPFQMHVWEYTPSYSSGGDGSTNFDLLSTLSHIGNCPSAGTCTRPDIVNLSRQQPVPPGGITDALLVDANYASGVFGQFPADTLLVASAGNNPDGYATPTIAQHNLLAQWVSNWAPSSLIVAGSDPRESAGDQPFDTLSGPEVDLAAPSYAGVVPIDNGHPIPGPVYGWATGTSISAPLVSSAVALVYAIGGTPSGSSTPMTVADAATEVTSQAIPITMDSTIYSDWGGPMIRLDLFGAVLDTMAMTGALDTAVRVFADDDNSASATATLYSEEVDPADGTFDASTLHSVSLTDEGCTEAGDVEVDPRGDMVYVLCTGDPGSVYAYTTQNLDYVGKAELTGAVDLTTEMVVTVDSVVLVPSVSGSDEVVDLWDSFDGGKIGETTVDASGVTEVEGAVAYTDTSSTSLFADRAAVCGFDGSYTDGDNHVAQLDLNFYNRTSTSDAVVPNLVDFSSITAGRARDISWNPTDETLDTVFYYDSTGYDELAELQSDGTFSAGATLEDPSGSPDINNLYTIATNPSGEDAYAYIGAYSTSDPGSQVFAMTDMNQSSSPYDADAEYEHVAGATFYPRIARFSGNGKFVAFGFAATATGEPDVWTIPHDPGAAGLYDVSSVGDAMSHSFQKTRGVAISPAMSILSPRPGKELSGIHRVYVLVRDPDVVTVSYTLNGSAISTCPDDAALSDGVSDSCLLDTTDTSTWTGDDDVLEVHAEYSDGTGFSVYGYW